jgi:hypothetical protein
MNEELTLDRYAVMDDFAIPHPTGKFVLFSDVAVLIDRLCKVIEAHNGAANSPANAVFFDETIPPEVWYAVVDRDLAISAEVWTEFAKANGV